MRLFCLSLIMVILMGGVFAPRYEEHKTGPGSFNYWRYKDRGIERTISETEEFIKELNKKIEKYIQNNPQRPEWIKQNLLAGQTTIEMTKEEILLLLDKPLNKTPTSEYGADEVWVYHMYDIGWHSEDKFYFKDNVVIKILGFQTGNVL